MSIVTNCAARLTQRPFNIRHSTFNILIHHFHPSPSHVTSNALLLPHPGQLLLLLLLHASQQGLDVRAALRFLLTVLRRLAGRLRSGRTWVGLAALSP